MNQNLIDNLKKGLHLEKCDILIPWKTPFENLTDYGEPEFEQTSDQRADFVWKNERILNGLNVDINIMRWIGLGGMNKKFESAFAYLPQKEFEKTITMLNNEFGQEGKYKKVNELEYKYTWKLKECKIELNQKERFGSHWNIEIKYGQKRQKVNKVTIILISIGISINLFSQELTEELIVEFYNQTYMDYFNQQKQTYEKTDFYIQRDSLQPLIQSEFADFNLHFVNKQQEQELIKKNKISELYWTKINHVSKDTIDILISGWTVDYKRKFLKKGTFEYAAWCGGTNGYVPQARFVLNKKTAKWDYITEKEIIDSIITEYQNKLKE